MFGREDKRENKKESPEGRPDQGGVLSRWMRENGPDGDVVLSSRVRLARNLKGIPFPRIASEKQLEEVMDAIESATQRAPASVGRLRVLRLDDLPGIERVALLERHLISPMLAQNPDHRAVVLRDDEAISVMVNEEDHLRIQAMFPGLDLDEVLGLTNLVDDFYDQALDIAFSPQLGFLTACPTNVGTGLRASVMVHLPALAMTGQIQKLVTASSQLGLAVRGLYGEGTEPVGSIFQISNQLTLGRTEEQIVNHLASVTRQVVAQEREARGRLLESSRLAVDDRVHRAYGLLANVRSVNSQEAMVLLSDVRLGIDLGLIKDVEPTVLKDLLVAIRPATLQKLVGRSLGADERDIERASLVRARLAKARQQHQQ